jgi:hypothetical protein
VSSLPFGPSGTYQRSRSSAVPPGPARVRTTFLREIDIGGPGSRVIMHDVIFDEVVVQITAQT